MCPVERHEHQQLSPAGQLDQLGALAAGLKYNRTGRRRALRMLAGLAAVLVVLVGVLALYPWLWGS
jgi:hypothetical protein